MLVSACTMHLRSCRAGFRALDRFLTYAKGRRMGLVRPKDEIARYVLANRATTPIVDRVRRA